MTTSSSLFPRRDKPRFFLLVVLLYLQSLLVGCAAVQLPPAGQDFQAHYISGVPFYHLARQENSCGPAALAGVISFWNRVISMEQIVARVYLPELRGSLPMDMEQFLVDSGLVTAASSGTMDALKTQILRNVPVISLLDLGFGAYRQPHYVTVIGFDDAKGVFTVHDGLTANKTIEYDRFLKAWERAGSWMLVAVPGIQVKRAVP